MFENFTQDIKIRPAEPDDDQIIGRFLSTTKFAWFGSSWSLRYSRQSQFEDRFECVLPEDYANAALRALNETSGGRALAVPICDAWSRFLATMADHWLISCWTLIDSHHDDYLLWHKYAGGETGVGITVRYGVLKECLTENRNAGPIPIGGLVDYVSYLLNMPFNKRPIFRNEKEVRFAKNFQERLLAVESTLVNEISDQFRLRFAPDAPDHHRKAVEHVWTACGGKF